MNTENGNKKTNCILNSEKSKKFISFIKMFIGFSVSQFFK